MDGLCHEAKRFPYSACDRIFLGNSSDNDEIVKRVSCFTRSSTFCTKSSIMTEARPLRSSPRTFVRPSLKALTHLRTIPQVIMFYSSTSLIWRSILAAFTSLALRKRITDRVLQATGFSIGHFNAFKSNVNMVECCRNGACGLPTDVVPQRAARNSDRSAAKLEF